MAKVDYTERVRPLSLFHRFYDAVSDLIFFYDVPDLRISEANKAFFEYTGYRPDDVIGRPLTDFVAADGRAEFDRSLKAVKADGSFTGSLRLTIKDGTVRDLRCTDTAIRNDEEIFGVVTVAWDQSTEHIERIIDRHEDEKKALTEILPVAVLTVDAEKKIALWNKEAERITGFSAGDMIGKSCTDLLSPLCEETCGLVAAGGEQAPARARLTMRDRDGSEKTISKRSSVLKDASGAVTGCITSFIDITEQIKIEEGLKRSTERFKILFNFAPDAYFLFDLKGKLIDGNLAARGLFGLTKEEMKGKGIFEMGFIPTQDEVRARTIFDRIGHGLPTGPDEFALLRKDGTTFHAEIRTYPVKIDDQDLVLTIARDISERRRSEELLRESEKQWRNLIETSRDTIFITTAEGKFLEMNPAGLALFGYTHDEILSIAVKDLYNDPEDRTRFQEEMRREGFVTDYEVPLKAKDGRVIEGLITANLRRDDDGTIIGYQGIVKDITERKQAEEAVRKSEEKYRELVEYANSIILRMNTKGIITFFNEYAQVFFGYWEKEIIGQHVIGTIVPKTESTGRDLEKMIIDIGKNPDKYQGNENENMTRDGDRVWIAWTNRPIYDEDGKVTEILCVGHDVTERRKAEEAMRESEEKWHDLFESSKDVVFFSTPEGRILEMNPAGEELFGYTMDELLKIQIRDLYNAPEDRTRFKECMAKQGFVKDFGVTFRRKDGSLVDCRMTGTLKKDKNGSTSWYQGNIRDISDITKKQAELEKMKQMAEEANRAKSDFLANMSHEIRTPMNGILGFADLLMEEPLTDEQREYAKTIYQSGQTLLTLINDILDLSKIESGRMVVNNEEFDLGELLEQTLMITRPRAQAKQLTLNLAFEPGTPAKIISDPDKIRHVLTNLVGNAIKFTDCGGIDVTAGVAARGKRKGRLTISVKDTGCGIPPDKLDVIFDPFMQADASTTRKYGGTGLGLSITKKMVELLDGGITVLSSPGQGSTFSFYLPIELSEEICEARPVAQPQKVLIVEDDPLTLKLYRGFLERHDFEVISTKLGREGLGLALKHNPDIIILDIILPDTSGWEVLQELKAHEKTKGIPIIVVSILSEKDKALSLGAVDYIEKPVAGQALIKKIELLVHSEEQKGEKKIVVLNGDSAIGASLTEMLEKRGFSTAAFTSPKEAVSYLMADQAQDIAALMIFLENLRDFDFVTLVKEEPNLTRIPIIFITDKEMSRDEVKRLEGISYSLLEKGDLVSPAALFEIDKSIEEARRGTRTPKQETPARRASVSGARIFLVEDNEVNQKLITKILSREGYEVTVADNGADALTVLKDKDFDLILMDIQMPVMDGYEATSRIKSDEKKKMIPIIALTAHAMKGYEEKVYEAGFDGYLKKPIKKEELLAELAERLAGCVDERPAPEEVWAEEEGASSASPEDELKAIYREFDESLPGKYDLVADAVERKDYDAVYRHGHDLKGTGGAFGREKISVLGRQIESAAKEKKDDVLTFLLGSLKDEIESIQKEIQ